MILDAKHEAIQLLLEREHQENLHQGTEYLWNVVQQRFWIIGLRNALRSIKYHCVKCRKGGIKAYQPKISDLLPERVSNGICSFQITEVHFFDPMGVKFLRRSLKRWCCLFPCLAPGAVHIQIIHSLDTESGLAAISNFDARWGQPNTILSDNGNNFVGAAKELNAQITSWNQREIKEKLMLSNIFWIFNPTPSRELLTLVGSGSA